MIQSLFTTMPMFVCLFWAVVLLMRYRASDRAKKALTVFMFAAAVLYFAHCVYFNRAYSLLPFTDTLYSFANVAVYPLYLLYITAMTSSRPLSLRNYSILLPAALLGMAVGICYLAMDGAQLAKFVTDYLYQGNESDMGGIAGVQAWLHDAVKAVFAIQLIPVMYFGLRKITAYDKLVMSYYSYTDNKSLRRIKNMLLYFVVTSVFSFVINIIGRAWFADSVDAVIAPSILFSALLFAIGYIGTNMEFTAD